MTICRPVKLNRKIRHLNRIIKNATNEAKACRDAATYYQEEVEQIKERFHLWGYKEISPQPDRPY